MERIALTVPEMAKSLGIGVNKAYDLLHIEGFPCIRVGGKYIIPIEPLKKWVECAAGGKVRLEGEEQPNEI